MNKRIAIFPGSFDPYTKGHHDIIMRSINLFDQIIIAFGDNSQKKRTFEIPFLIEKLNKLYASYKNIKVVEYTGLTVDFALQNEAQYILRGLRNGADLEYERPIAGANNKLNPDIETIFMLTKPEYSIISSTIVRELLRYNKDISDFLPYKL